MLLTAVLHEIRHPLSGQAMPLIKLELAVLAEITHPFETHDIPSSPLEFAVLPEIALLLAPRIPSLRLASAVQPWITELLPVWMPFLFASAWTFRMMACAPARIPYPPAKLVIVPFSTLSSATFPLIPLPLLEGPVTVIANPFKSMVTWFTVTWMASPLPLSVSGPVRR